jgi:uncharacterized protein YuzE
MAQLVRWDREVNAAYIGFREIGPGEAAKQIPVTDEHGVTAVLDFTEDGELLGIELLDAERQLPKHLRG